MGRRLPPDLGYHLDVIDEAMEARLLKHMRNCDLAYMPIDPGNRRSSVSFGWKYDYRSDTFVPCAPLPDWMEPLRDRAAEISGLPGEDFVECLVNRYEPGSVIQWHFDKPVWEEVVGISLGNTAIMHFRREAPQGFDVAEAELPPRSLYVLKGQARHDWKHHLPPMPSERWSVTFRRPSEQGRSMLAAQGSNIFEEFPAR